MLSRGYSHRMGGNSLLSKKKRKDKVNETKSSRDQTRMAIQIEKSKIIENPYKPYAKLSYSLLHPPREITYG